VTAYLVRFHKNCETKPIGENAMNANAGAARQRRKSTKMPRSLEIQITVQRDKLKKLEDRLNDLQRREIDKNRKMISDLIKSEKLDLISCDHWRTVLPKIRKLLNSQMSSSTSRNCAHGDSRFLLTGNSSI
jgi:hypothetical protein